MRVLKRAFSVSAASSLARCLVVGPTANASLRSAVRAAVACTGGDAVDVMLTGGSSDAASEAARWSSVARVITASAPHSLAEVVAPVVVSEVKGRGYEYVVASAGSAGKDVLPRVAGILDVSPISDVTQVVGTGDCATFVRPIYAGNAVATVESSDPVKVVTVRTSAFEPIGDGGEPALIEEVDTSKFLEANSSSKFVGEDMMSSTRPELGSARVVVSGGRALKNADHFAALERLADLLGGAVGATRAAVDSGIVPNDLQIGQTGKVVAPELYIAVGISGAIQHLAGMKDSRVIVAINKDPEAPIFQVADYGLVGDLFDILPELEEKLK